MKLFISLIIIALICYCIYLYIRIKLKNKIEVITAYTGGLGSGKSLNSAILVKKLYLKNKRIRKRKLWWNNKVLPKFSYKKKEKIYIDQIRVFSNIPLKLGKNNYSLKLTKEHLLLQEKLPYGSIIYLDEIGSFASQFDWNQNNVIKVFDEFCRFYRHYVSNSKYGIQAYMVVNDQCSENINLVIRRRLNTIHNLSNCLVLWRFCFYYDRMINISEEIKTIDIANVDSQQVDTQDNKKLCFKFLWNRKLYDTYCYSDRYDSVPKKDFEAFNRLKTTKLLRCPKDKELEVSPKTSERKDY